MYRINAPTSQEWDTSLLSDGRQLGAAVPFEQLVGDIAEAAKVADAYQKPRQSGSASEQREFAQAIYRASLPPALFDQLYNGFDGLRGRYWRSAATGDAATGQLIRAIAVRVIGTPLRVICDQGWLLTRDLVETALEMGSAKIWVSETDQDGFGLIDGENEERLRVTRWERNEALRDNDRSWRWTPAHGHIEIKSALVNREGKEWIPPEKKDRGEQIHKFGWT